MEHISKIKYEFLKRMPNTLSSDEKKQIEEYEKGNKKDPSEAEKEYNRKIKRLNNSENFEVKYDVLLEKFITKFKELELKDFNTDQLHNIDVILYYFSRDKRFFDCDNLTNISTPSFDKGLLIVGGYGNGKTSTFRTLKELFNGTPLVFKSYTANKVVSTFEGTSKSSERHAYLSRTKKGTCYFDDVKTEKTASNYGLFNLFKDIIEERYINKSKTYITCNFREGDSSQDINDALLEFGEKYGDRVYDRLFEMFNIIHFKGKSLRK